MSKKNILFSVICTLFCISFLSNLKAQSPTVKIDINALRNNSEVQYDYPNTSHFAWGSNDGTRLQDTLVANGISFFLKKGPRGETLSGSWYKLSVQSGQYEAKFTNDGVYVKDGDFASGSEIDLIIKNLPTGVHSLTTFHNIPDGLTAGNICPIDVYVNGVLKIEGLEPTVRLEKITEVATADLEINAIEGQEVVISFKAQTTGNQAIKNVYINGIYLNAVNVGKKARAIDPVSQNFYLDVPNGNNYTLKWQASPSAISHDVYFGKDSAGVASADHNSSFFKGNQSKTDTTLTVPNLNSMETYYWRIDEVGEDQTYKGDVWTFRTRQLAFAGAEGYGRFARGGRGGKVVHVTNLNDSGPGSLREAVTNNIGPRTIVFDVGGVIALESRLVLSDRYVTIAGQTAPGNGICIRQNPFGIGGQDAIIRFVRLRLGAGPTADGMGLGTNNSIMDHCSISWTIDEAFSSRGGKNITLQKTLISEALNSANHKNYPSGTEHGYAATISGDIGSFHHNLLAHCYGRNWSLGGGLDAAGFFTSRLDIRNNVVYNWGSRATDGGAHEVNFVNNYYKRGPGTTLNYALTAQYENVGMGTQKYFFNGNVMPGVFDETNQSVGRRTTYSNGNPPLTYENFVDVPFFDSYVTTQSAYHAYKVVLSDVGANQPFFDLHDVRMINETLNGTYSVTGSKTGKKGFPDDQHDTPEWNYEAQYPSVARKSNWDSDKDGLPDWWENIKGTNVNSSPNDFSDANEDNDRDGITELEHYLEWMAEPHFQSISGEKVTIDLKELSRGFVASPSFVLHDFTNGSATLSNGVVEFTPSANGLASFKFTVTDADNHSMTRIVNIVAGVDISMLPVTIVNYKAERVSTKEVKMSWNTVQEHNNSHFEIQRSNDGKEFKNIGVKIVSKAISGISNTKLFYDYVDENNSMSDTYYQLVQVDQDGKRSNSEIRVVKGNPIRLDVWPVPSKGDVFVSVGELDKPANIRIYDVSGKVVAVKKIQPNQTEVLNINPKGVMILKVESIDGRELLTKKILIE
ncbi:T9SS type A sorting domain-containing protein [Pelobium manganitolerans]|uniref:T9SS type A sorting domain-containing protein n=1 Tax=Pelobium manganitolerans TaxID=1842495 RepID=UPI003FA38CA0